MPTDHYQTLVRRTTARLKVQRSDFLAVAFPVTSEEQFFSELMKIEKEHFDATHHCWAYRLFHETRSRSSDAGEPSGTAGKPIHGAIESAEIFDAAVVVVRWFGGTKLGTGGLARAYRDAAAAVLASAERANCFLYRRYRVTVPFDLLSTIYRLLDPPNIVLAAETFGEENLFDVDVRESWTTRLETALAEKRLPFVRL